VSKVHIGRQGFLTKSAIPSVTRTQSVPATILLLQGNGTNGQTTFTDSSLYAYTVNRTGSTQISTAQFPTGMSSSILFPGTGNDLFVGSQGTAPAGTASLPGTIWGTGAFTIELFMYAISFTNSTVGNEKTILRFNNTTGATNMFCTMNMINAGNGTTAAFGWYTIPGGSVQRLTGSILNAGQWYHLAICRTSNATNGLRLYVNGILELTTTDSGNYSVGFPGIQINAPSSYSFNGYFSNLRITSGYELYTGSSFTPPSLPLSIYNGTIDTSITNNIYGVYKRL
jgi:hypothetical protein